MQNQKLTRRDAIISAGADFPQIDPVPHSRSTRDPLLVYTLAVGVPVVLMLLALLWAQ